MAADRVLISRRIAGCGCPEEVWMVAGLDVQIHFEDGHADCFVDSGDWDVTNRHSGDEATAREAAFTFIESWNND